MSQPVDIRPDSRLDAGQTPRQGGQPHAGTRYLIEGGRRRGRPRRADSVQPVEGLAPLVIPQGAPMDFPPEREWLPSGLVAVGADLSPRRLVQAYSRGIFPWYTQGSPILWWSPAPRCVLFTEELHVPRSLARTLRRGHFSFTINKAFIEVIRGCAETRRPGQNGTWLTSSMIAAYLGLHRLGLAHSVECWLDGGLVGGLYGVALGRIFFGESMFHTRPDASKAALVTLIRCMRDQDFLLLDCQQTTPHMERLGAREIPRLRFLRLVEDHGRIRPDHTGPSFRNTVPDM